MKIAMVQSIGMVSLLDLALAIIETTLGMTCYSCLVVAFLYYTKTGVKV
jgi:hypothetical protein